MHSLTLTNGTNQRFQMHYLTNVEPQRLAFVEMEPGETKTVLTGEEEQMRAIVSQNQRYGMVPAGEEKGPCITYVIAEGEVEGVDTVHRELHDEEAGVHVPAVGNKG